MELLEKIQHLEETIRQLRIERDAEKENYKILKSEFISLIEKFNTRVRLSNQNEQQFLERIAELQREVDALKMESAKVESVFNQTATESATQKCADSTEFMGAEQPKVEPVEKVEAEQPKVEPVEKVEAEQPKVEPVEKVEAEQPKVAAAKRVDVEPQQSVLDKYGKAMAETVVKQTATAEDPSANKSAQQTSSAPKTEKPKESKIPSFDLEKFVGENLISKLGILILLIGVAIGGRYAIANDLISPTLRIILGFVLAFVMQGFAIKLKKDYKPFSAILSSGSFAIMYFMTYFAYGFYGLINMPFAFVLMMLITVCTVYSAWWYDLQIIAIIGQVGAYVIPFMLSTGDGNVFVLLAYVALIDLGIMIVSIKKYWRILFVFSFATTWLIVTVAYNSGSFDQVGDSVKMLACIGMLFLLFYTTFLANKLINNRVFEQFDIYFLLSNSFLFYGFGFRLLAEPAHLAAYHGVFTLCNALVHLVVVSVIIRRKLFDDALRMIIMGLGILFITLAILVWGTGHWITMLWILEGAILFYVARTKQITFYERMAYSQFVFALLSLFVDWGNPEGVHDSIFSVFFTVFHGMRETWDSSHSVAQGPVSQYINTAFFLITVGWVFYIDSKYPAKDKVASEIVTKALAIGIVSIVTLAIFVHFDAEICTMLWVSEAAILFYFARTKPYALFETLSYPVLVIAMISLFSDWGNPYGVDNEVFRVFYELFHRRGLIDPAGTGVVMQYVDTIFFLVVFGFILFINSRYNQEKELGNVKMTTILIGAGVGVLTLTVLAFARVEICTILWILEGAILFYLARRNKSVALEVISYPVFVFALFSLFSDWGNPYGLDSDMFGGIYDVFSRHTGVDEVNLGVVMRWVNTIFFLLTVGGVVYFNFSLPADHNPSNKIVTKVLIISLVALVAMAIFVHFKIEVCTMLWAAETVIVAYLAMRYKIESANGILFALVTIASIGLVFVMDKHCPNDGEGISAMLNITTAVYVLCMGGLLYISRRLDEKSLFPDLVIWLLVLSPILTVCFDLDILLIREHGVDNYTKYYIVAFLLCYFSVLYFLSHRFDWKGFPVKMMLVLRCLVALTVIAVFNELREDRSCVINLVADVESGDIQTELVNAGSYCFARYAIIVFVLFSIFLMWLYRKSTYRLLSSIDESMHKMLQDTFMLVVAICVMSSELLNICDFMGYHSSFKLLLSILWGVCGLVLVYFGLFRNMKYIRIEGIVLFAVTLIKLFLFDISDYDTLSKTIVMVSIGGLLLVVSFFYQKIAKQQEKLNAAQVASEPKVEKVEPEQTQNEVHAEVQPQTEDQNESQEHE